MQLISWNDYSIHRNFNHYLVFVKSYYFLQSHWITIYLKMRCSNTTYNAWEVPFWWSGMWFRQKFLVRYSLRRLDSVSAFINFGQYAPTPQSSTPGSDWRFCIVVRLLSFFKSNVFHISHGVSYYSCTVACLFSKNWQVSV